LGVLLLAILAAAAWLIGLRRRRRLVDEQMVVVGVAGAMVVGLFASAAVLVTRLPPGPTAIVALVVVLAFGLRSAGYRPSDLRNLRRWSASLTGSSASTAERQMSLRSGPDTTAESTLSGSVTRSEVRMSAVPERSRRARSQLALGCAGLALFAIGASFATVTARKEWIPPPELSVIHEPAGQFVAGVTLGSAGPVAARVEVVSAGKVLWSAPLSRRTAAQSVVLPAGQLPSGSHVLLVSSGHTLREVDD
jgi:hypothetical protein